MGIPMNHSIQMERSDLPLDGADPGVTVISTECGHGSGAESVLVELLGGWDTNDGPLRLLSPIGSLPARAARTACIGLDDLSASRDAMLPNLGAVLRRLPELRSAKVVHAWHSRGFELALLAGRLLGIPATGTIHDHPECSTHGALRRRVIRQAARRLNGLVFVSDAVAKAWRPLGHSRASVTIHNGMRDMPADRPASDMVRVGFLGMNAPWKGFPIAADWASRTAGHGVRWRFYGDVHPAVAAQIRERGEATITGSVAGRRSAREIFDEVDILVHASTEFDPFPTVLLEAARAAVPVVASSLGGGSEIVDDGTTGYIFDPRQPNRGYSRLAALLGSYDLRERMGRAARARYEQRFTISRMTKGYAAFWNQSFR